MAQTTLRLLVIAATPLLAGLFFGLVELVNRRGSQPVYDNQNTQLYYAIFVSGFAAVFLLATNLDLSLEYAFWFPAFGVLGVAMYWIDTLAWMRWTGKSIRRGDQRLVWLLPSLAAPVPEEILYRAGLDVLRGSVGVGGFVAVSAVLFGFAHVFRGKKEIAFKTFNGVVYALVYVGTGSVLAPIIAHFGYNVMYVWYVSDAPTHRDLLG